jgi:hypothetical protein
VNLPLLEHFTILPTLKTTGQVINSWAKALAGNAGIATEADKATIITLFFFIVLTYCLYGSTLVQNNFDFKIIIMVSITSDSPHIERAFSKLIKTLEEAGSGFHSSLCVDASTKGICISTKEPMQTGREIIRIPRAALMPGDQYVVKLVGDNLVIDYFINTTLKDRQKAIIEQMFEIYNLTAKIPEHKKINFLISLKSYPELYEKLMAKRHYNPKYDKWFKGLQDGMDNAEYHKFLIDTFIQTRPLGYSDPIREDSMSTIMPVIDFLNHHWEGGHFNVGGGTRVGDLTINASQPFKNSTECFAFYGVLDAADALIRYNFVDESTHVVRSIELELEVPDGRKIMIGNKHHEPKGRFMLPEEISDLVSYAPSFSFAEDEGKGEAEQDLSASFLLLSTPASRAPLALRRTLTYAIRHMHTKFNKDIDFNIVDWVAEAENKIIEVNKKHYEDIRSCTRSLISEKGESENLARIKRLADIQLQRLEEYAEFAGSRKVEIYVRAQDAAGKARTA